MAREHEDTDCPPKSQLQRADLELMKGVLILTLTMGGCVHSFPAADEKWLYLGQKSLDAVTPIDHDQSNNL